MRLIRVIGAVVMIAMACARAEDAKKNLVINGTFDDVKEGKPAAWGLPPRGADVTIVEEGGGKCLRVTAAEPKTVYAKQRFKVEEGWASVTVKTKMRAKNVKLGEKEFQTPRLSILFTDAEGKRVGDWPPAPELKADSDWKELTLTVPVVKEAKFIELRAGFVASSGQVDFDDVVMEVGKAPEEKK